MKSFSWAALAALLLATASHAQTEVRLAVHKSFSLPKDAFVAFEKANQAKVSVIKVGSGNEMVNKLIVSRAQPVPMRCMVWTIRRRLKPSKRVFWQINSPPVATRWRR